MTENVKILTCLVLFFNLTTFSLVQTKCFISIPCHFCVYGFKSNLSKPTTLTLAQMFSSPHALNMTLHTQPLPQKPLNHCLPAVREDDNRGLLLPYFPHKLNLWLERTDL